MPSTITAMSSIVSLIVMAFFSGVTFLTTSLEESLVDSKGNQYQDEVTTTAPKNGSKEWNPCNICHTNPQFFNVLFFLTLCVLIVLIIVVTNSCFYLYKMDRRRIFRRKQRTPIKTQKRSTLDDSYERPSDIPLNALKRTDSNEYEKPGPISRDDRNVINLLEN